MGAGMARSLARAGHDVVVWNRSAEKAAALAGGRISVAESVSAAVTGSSAVVTVLFDAEAVLGVADEIKAALGSAAVWVQTSTVGPDGARRIAQAAGPRMVDAPVLGTKSPAENGALVVLASGREELVRLATPVFAAIGSRTVVAGPEIGQASALKLACNAWVALLAAGTAQSLALAQALGVEPALFLDAIKGGPSDSAYAQLKGGLMLEENWATSFAVDGVRKDIGLMVDAARGADFPVGLLSALLEQFDRASEQGHGEDDMAAVRTAFPSD